MKRIIDSTLVILSLMLISAARKVGQETHCQRQHVYWTTDSDFGQSFTKQDRSEDAANAVIRTQSPKSKDFDFGSIYYVRGETVQLLSITYNSHPKDDVFDPNEAGRIAV